MRVKDPAQIRRRRERHRFTQRDLAHLVRRSQTAVHALETGRLRTVSDEFALAVAARLDAPWEELFEATDSSVAPRVTTGAHATEHHVGTTTVWQLCVCEQATHDPADRELPRPSRQEAARALQYYPTGTAHLLRLTTLTVAEPARCDLDAPDDGSTDPADRSDRSDPEPYDRTDEHDHLRDDPWGDH